VDAASTTLALPAAPLRLDAIRDPARRYLLAVLASALAFAVRAALTPLLGDRFPFSSFYLAILITSWFAGIGPGVLVTALGMLFTSMFWLDPVGVPHLATTADVHGVVFAGGVGIAIAVAAASARRSQARAREATRAAELNAWRIARLHRLTRETTGAVGLDGVVELIARHGAAMLSAHATLMAIADQPDGPLRLARVRRLEGGELERIGGDAIPAAMRCAVRGTRVLVFARLDAEEPSDVETGGVVAAPLLREGRAVGVLAFELPPRHVGPEDLRLVEGIAAECALVVDRARLFEAEREARTRAERAVAAHKDLLAIVSHDLRSPLGVVLMAAERVAKSGHADVERAATMMKRAGDRMSALISDLLDAANVEAGAFRVRCHDAIAVRALVDEAVLLARPSATQRQLTLEAIVSDDGAMMVCDRHRLLQVLGNLLGNAIRLTPEGGTITVRAIPRTDEVEIAVSDTGPGIPTEQLEHIFTRHFRGARGGGAGLGLFITKGIVEAHGGHIAVESAPGQGATFRFTLPRRAARGCGRAIVGALR
jgi:signal transduction histidine kinase